MRLTKPSHPSHVTPNQGQQEGCVPALLLQKPPGTKTFNLGTEGQSLVEHRKVLQRLCSWTVWVLAWCGGAGVC